MIKNRKLRTEPSRVSTMWWFSLCFIWPPTLAKTRMWSRRMGTLGDVSNVHITWFQSFLDVALQGLKNTIVDATTIRGNVNCVAIVVSAGLRRVFDQERPARLKDPRAFARPPNTSNIFRSPAWTVVGVAVAGANVAFSAVEVTPIALSRPLPCPFQWPFVSHFVPPPTKVKRGCAIFDARVFLYSEGSLHQGTYFLHQTFRPKGMCCRKKCYSMPSFATPSQEIDSVRSDSHAWNMSTFGDQGAVDIKNYPKWANPQAPVRF